MKRKTSPTPGAYAIICLANRKAYIGSSRNVESRIAGHMAQLRANRHAMLPRMQRDWNEFGAKSFLVARIPCSEEECRSIEWTLIETFRTLEHQGGYNKMIGGKWGIEASIRNSEEKLVKAGKLCRIPGVAPETPMTKTYVSTVQRGDQSHLTKGRR